MKNIPTAVERGRVEPGELELERRRANIRDIVGSIESRESLLTFLVTPSLPRLAITSSNNVVIVSWPSPSTGFALQQNINGLSSGNWSNVTSGIQDDGTNKSLIINPAGQSHFYRLTNP